MKVSGYVIYANVWGCRYYLQNRNSCYELNGLVNNAAIFTTYEEAVGVIALVGGNFKSRLLTSKVTELNIC